MRAAPACACRRATRAATRSTSSRMASTSSWKALQFVAADHVARFLGDVFRGALGQRRRGGARLLQRRREGIGDLHAEHVAEHGGERLLPVRIEALGQALQAAREFGIAGDAHAADGRRVVALEERAAARASRRACCARRGRVRARRRRADDEAFAFDAELQARAAVHRSSARCGGRRAARSAARVSGSSASARLSAASSARPAIGFQFERHVGHAGILAVACSLPSEWRGGLGGVSAFMKMVGAHATPPSLPCIRRGGAYALLGETLAATQPLVDRHPRHVAEIARRRRHVVPMRGAELLGEETRHRRFAAQRQQRPQPFAHRADRVGGAERQIVLSTSGAPAARSRPLTISRTVLGSPLLMK